MKDPADTWLQLLCTVNNLKSVCLELKALEKEMHQMLQKLGAVIAAGENLSNQASEFIMANK